MKLFLTQREKLQSLGSALVNELDSLVAKIRTSWKIEHTDEGQHGNVHAQSISTGRLVYGDIASTSIAESQVNNFDPPGLSTASLLRLDSTLEEVSLTGLRVPQDETGAVLDGRVLVVENITADTTFVLEADHTASAPRNRFVTPWGPSASTDSPLRFYIRPSSLVVLIYNANKTRWVVQSQAKDANTKTSSFAASRQDDVDTSAIRRAQTVKVEFDGTGGSISGFAGTNVPETTRLTLVNSGLYKFTVLHQNTNSLEANRIQCPGGVQYVLHPRESVDILKTDSGWQIVEKADQWIDVTYASGNFTTDTGTWTVGSGDQMTYAYQIDGNKMTVSFDLQTTTVASSPTQLRIAIPGARAVARDMLNTVIAMDAGTQISTAFVQATTGNTYLIVYKNISGGAWGAATNTTHARGQITFMVQDDSADISESHSDVAHGDTAHADVDHSDTAHTDVAHGDSHSDTAHSDISHSDIAHSDTHSDTSHSDTHSDVSHLDTAHVDVTHGDFTHHDVDDFPIHQHEDTPFSDVAHSDRAHTDTHTDTAHHDSHTDVTHADTAHADGGHADTHADTVPHSDVAHVDVTHGDTAHADNAHTDAGYHTDTTHSDV